MASAGQIQASRPPGVVPAGMRILRPHHRNCTISTMPETLQKAPNCLTCTHFKVSWDPAYPRSCTVFGIKTRNMPSAEVFAATGIHCPSYERKPGLK
jgi:hypothetical protein